MALLTESVARAVYLWNPETLDWEAATKGTGTGELVAVDNWPAVLTGEVVPVTSDDPTSKYKITDLDTSGDPQYFGYTDKDGAWYIMRLSGTEARYARGLSNYESNWSNRTKLTYDYFFNVF